MSQRPEGTFRPPVGILAAIGAAAVAVGLFGVPLGTVLLVGLFLLCPLMMAGMHGDGHSHGQAGGSHEGHSPAAPGPDDADVPQPHRH